MKRAIIMAAGQGKRMKSAVPKVLHEICGRPMLWYVVEELRAAGFTDIAVVVSPALSTRSELALLGDVRLVVQAEARGTGDAVKTALASFPIEPNATLLVANGDMPLLDAALFSSLVEEAERGAAMVVGVARMGAQSQFGRIVRNADQSVERIVEMRDATPAQAALAEMNIGIYAFAESALRELLPNLTNANAQGEYYLTDMLALLRAQNQPVAALEITDVTRVLGINDRVELSFAQRAMNARLCEQHMRNGVTILDPATTYLEPGIRIGMDTVIAPNTTICGGSEIAGAAVIGPNTRIDMSQVGARSVIRESVIRESTVGADCVIGPFAHLRLSTVLADDVRVGNFVEMKNSTVAGGVRAGHLSYLGDADVGTGTNIGAGTITCNFDGVNKHRTTIGANAFIGSNSSLIAPVQIGEGALTGAGSVVLKDVAKGARVVGNPAREIAGRPLPVHTGS